MAIKTSVTGNRVTIEDSVYFIKPAGINRYTGKTLSISLWETREHLEARKDQTPPEGAASLKPTATEVFQLFEDL